MDWIKQTGAGKIYVQGRNSNTKHLLNPQIIREDNTGRKSNQNRVEEQQRFKLATCRRLTQYTQEELIVLAQQTQSV